MRSLRNFVAAGQPPCHPAAAQAPEGRTAYLSELCSGAEVLVADAQGRTRTAIVGRIKLEARPLVGAGRVCGGGAMFVGCIPRGRPWRGAFSWRLR
jgi:hypothetical protein